MAVHVVGNVCIDTTFRLDRFPAVGETMNALGVSDGLGGKGANQAVAARRAGADVTLWAAVGSDETAGLIRAALSEEGLCLCGLAHVDLPSDRSSIFVDAAGDNLIVTSAACAAAFVPLSDGDFELFVAPGDIVLMQANLCPEVTAECLAFAKAHGASTIVNASPLVEGAGLHLGHVDIVVVNAGEARMLTGEDEPEAAARALLRRGPHQAVVTLGASGVLLATGGDAANLSVPAPRVAAVDTSGAGDVFCGVLAGLLSTGRAIEAALGVAVEAAALSVMRPGTMRSCPSAAEIAALGHCPQTGICS